MPENFADYEIGVPEIIQKIDELKNKIDSIEHKTVFRQSVSNISIFLRELIQILGSKNTGNPDQMVKRFVTITRMLYVDTISSLEYEIRKFVELSDDSDLSSLQTKLARNPLMSISKIMKELNELDYFAEDYYEKLSGLFSIRNMVVHNHSKVNSARENVPQEIQNMFTDFSIGKRICGKPEMFINLISIVVDFYSPWHSDKSLLETILNEEIDSNH